MPKDQTLTPETQVDEPSLTPKVEEKATPEPSEAQEDAKVDKTEEGETPPPEVISKEEHQRVIDSLKGGHKGTVDKLKSDIKGLREEFIQLQTEKEESEIATFLRGVEEQGGDVNIAKVIAERDRKSREIQRDIAQKLADLDDREALLNEAAKGKTAYDLVKTYELEEDVVEELLKSEDLKEMENKALKLHLEKVKAKATPAEKPDKAIQAATKGVDVSKLPVQRRLGLAAEGQI